MSPSPLLKLKLLMKMFVKVCGLIINTIVIRMLMDAKTYPCRLGSKYWEVFAAFAIYSASD
jgi:hypothetical protein